MLIYITYTLRPLRNALDVRGRTVIQVKLYSTNTLYRWHNCTVTFQILVYCWRINFCETWSIVFHFFHAFFWNITIVCFFHVFACFFVDFLKNFAYFFHFLLFSMFFCFFLKYYTVFSFVFWILHIFFFLLFSIFLCFPVFCIFFFYIGNLYVCWFSDHIYIGLFIHFCL